MKRITSLFICTIALIGTLSAQNEKESFKPSGKVFVKMFSNFHSTFSDGTSASAFELDRAYLGYDFNLSENFSGKINFDIGNPGVGKLELTAYIKNAYLSYAKNNFTVTFGMIPTTQFGLQENFWGNRYVEKSFQDAYKMGASADLGLSASYKITEWLSADAIVANGEGFKNLQADNNFRSGIGITLSPVKNLNIRGYFDIMGTDSAQTTLASFVSYNFGKATIGAEYNLQQNTGYVDGKDYSGASVYAAINPVKNIKVFGRYDYLTSVSLEGQSTNWNNAKDGSLIIAGIEYQPVKGVKIAPNFRLWNPAKSELKPTQYLYLSCEIKF
jgi:hypothetical protein